VHWLEAVDFGLFRFINQTLSNPFFDAVMPYVSGHGIKIYFLAAVILAGLFLYWKGGVRGRLCVLMLALIIAPGDGLICNLIKHAVGRPRPFITHPDVRRPGSTHSAVTTDPMNPDVPGGAARGLTAYNSMPSSHAANWFAATMILLVYYRRSWRFMLPLASTVAFSRVYNGVHYPSDVLAGAILGAGYAAATMWALDALWRWTGQKWFPRCWEQMPSLVKAECRMVNEEKQPQPAS
jgi:undecaprenyl-diphosphatase